MTFTEKYHKSMQLAREWKTDKEIRDILGIKDVPLCNFNRATVISEVIRDETKYNSLNIQFSILAMGGLLDRINGMFDKYSGEELREIKETGYHCIELANPSVKNIRMIAKLVEMQYTKEEMLENLEKMFELEK